MELTIFNEGIKNDEKITDSFSYYNHVWLFWYC